MRSSPARLSSFYGMIRQDTAASRPREAPGTGARRDQGYHVSDVLPPSSDWGRARHNIPSRHIEDADHFFRDLSAEDVADRIAEFVKQTR